jgi:ligand-binding sensor domain-containing protein/anti-sigma regulatory factor (Ser/Thr protein kinase)
MRDYRKRLAMGLLGLLCLIAPLEPAMGLDPSKAITQYVHSSWGADQGLPHNGVHKILQTSDGYLWLGTEAGLARFDGIAFRVFDHTNTPALQDDFVFDLVEDTEGTLWIGTANGGVTYFRNGVFTHVEAIAERGGFTLAASADGSVWVGGYGGLKQLINRKVSRSYTTANGLSGDPIRRLVAGDDSSLWIATSVGLDRLANGKIEHHPLDGRLPGHVAMLYLDSDASLWIQRGDLRLMRQRQGRFEPWKHLDVPDSPIRDMLETRDGSLWFASTTAGLIRINGTTVSRYTTKDGLSSDEVNELYEDKDGNLWVGTNGGGLDRFREGAFTTFAKEEGLAGDGAYAVLEDSTGDVWVTTSAGLNRIHGDEVRSFTTADGLPTNNVSALLEDHGMNLLIGTDSGGLARMEQGRFAPGVSVDEGLAPYRVLGLMQDSKQRLWVSTDGGGLARYEKGKIDSYSRKNGLFADSIYALAEDAAGNVWIGTSGGLNSIKEGRVRKYTDNGLSHASVASLYVDSNDVLWIGTLGRGLFRFENGSFIRYTREHGLPDDSINSIQKDGAGNLWIGSNKGISRLDRDELNSFAAGRSQSVQPVLFGKADGMKSNETNSVTQPSSWRAHDGRLWFPTNRGVVVIDPSRVSLSGRNPVARFEEIRADDVGIDLGAPVVLAPGTQRLEIRYAAPNLSNPERTKYRYRLDGFDKDWVLGGSDRKAQYTNLAPGDYTFHVATSDESGRWAAKDSTLAFTLRPHFYQSGWFQALYLLFGAGVAVAIYRLRVNWLHARAGVLEERHRIAAEIHDTLAQGLSGVVFQTEAALLSMERAPHRTTKHLLSARDLAKSSLEQARYSVWNLSPPVPSQESLLESLSAMARQLAAGRVDALDIQTSGVEWPLSADAEHHVVLVAQEAISNAIQHGKARTLSIGLQFRLDALHLVIIDDGAGFTPAVNVNTHARGYGMGNMRRRSTSLHATLEVESEPGKGTHVTLAIPRPMRFAWLWRRLRASGDRE